MKTIQLFICTLLLPISLSAQEYLAYYDTKDAVAVAEHKLATYEKRSEVKRSHRWEFLSVIPKQFDKQVQKEAGKHYLGSQVACLKKLVEKSYITKEDVIPGDPMLRTIVRKPDVYYLTRKIEKHLIREVKEKELSLEEASAHFSHILKVVLTLADDSSDEAVAFEASISKNRKNVEEAIGLFEQVELADIYD